MWSENVLNLVLTWNNINNVKIHFYPWLSGNLNAMNVGILRDKKMDDKSI